jgi:hypothetical protein
MVRYASRFLDWLDNTGSDFRFDSDKRRTFLLSVWLHDVGKLVVPLEVMDKESRLGPALDNVRQRFRAMALLDRIALLEGRLSQSEAEMLTVVRDTGMELIERVNKAGFVTDEDLARIATLADRQYVDEDGNLQPWLTAEERKDLSVRKGTLTPEERAVMESHAAVTARILEHVTFPKIYSQVPNWASAHHEYLNGKGYPLHLKAEEIPWEVRLLTILDVFDALTARDRPYKAPMPAEKALGILHSMVDEGSLDGDILSLYEASKAWEETA